jgi:hypothetical protein
VLYHNKQGVPKKIRLGLCLIPWAQLIFVHPKFRPEKLIDISILSFSKQICGLNPQEMIILNVSIAEANQLKTSNKNICEQKINYNWL